MAKSTAEAEADGRVVTLTNPDKVFFSARGDTKLDLACYYLDVGPGALLGVFERPTVLKRYPDGAEGEFFYQKRVPVKGRPDWLQTVTVSFSSGRSTEELCPPDVAHLVWALNLGCLDLIERRRPRQATSAWWKEERGQRVFVDYNQNARDRTVASAYSVRANPEGCLSCPLAWEEVPDVEPGDLTMATVPARYHTVGDPAAGIEDHAGSLESLLELGARDERGGLGDAPWPPHFPKQHSEPERVQPSRARRPGR